jgi:hypothetical protein
VTVYNVSASRVGGYDRVGNEGWLGKLQTNEPPVDEQEQSQPGVPVTSATAAPHEASSLPLKALAMCYETDAATLLTQQPTLWTLATKDHALNAGPAPAGRAMGDAAQLGLLDLYMADPQIAALMALTVARPRRPRARSRKSRCACSAPSALRN